MQSPNTRDSRLSTEEVFSLSQISINFIDGM